jgi:hypothetical protein
MLLSEPLLTCWAGADDSTIQRGTWFKSVDHDSSDYNEGSREESNDLKSLSDIVTAYRSPGSEESESKAKSDVLEPIEVQVDTALPQEEEFSFFLKKKDKKSKRAAFSEWS